MLYFGSADAVRQSAKRAVGGGVRVAAHHRHARQGGALFRPHYMHNALADVFKRKISQCAEGFDVLIQCVYLQLGNRVFNAFVPMVGGGIVVGGGHHAVDAPQLAPGQLQPFKCLRAGDFVYQVAVDVEQGGAVGLFADNVAVPKFVVKGLCAHGFGLYEGGLLHGIIMRRWRVDKQNV